MLGIGEKFVKGEFRWPDTFPVASELARARVRSSRNSANEVYLTKRGCRFWDCCAVQREQAPSPQFPTVSEISTQQSEHQSELWAASVNLRTSPLQGSNGLPSRPNSHRLRLGRYSEQGRAYLITIVVHNRRPLFTDLRLGRLLVAELKHAHEQGWVDSMAWVVMPDHLHWLFQLREGTLAQVMQLTKSRSTLSINRALSSQGAFWQSGYHDSAVRDGEDLCHLARCIVANPIRAGLVKRCGDYPLWDACWL